MQSGALFDTGMHNRVLNTMIDLTAVAALVGIQIRVIAEWLPVLLIGAFIASLSTLILYYFMTRNNKEFAEERLLGLMGLSTGTITSGLVLIRIIDPEYKSTVPYELGLMAIPSLLMTIPFMPITIPAAFAQIFYQKSWTIPFYTSVAFFLFFGIIATTSKQNNRQNAKKIHQASAKNMFLKTYKKDSRLE